MKEAIELLLTATAAFMSASGVFWLYLRDQRRAKDANTRLLMGLAHDKIMSYGAHYIKQGYVTQDQYEDLRLYLYDPYRELGGNGTAERIMHLVDRLPLTEQSELAELAAQTTIRRTDPTATESDGKHDRTGHTRRRSTD